MEMMVSIVCTAYNHKAYIADALESFVRQKTEFPFEIIVNDDASPDGTAEIIREYAQKYPDLIRPILQKENRYSKGHHVLQETIDLATGKYIAVCEGDDYWIDENKLQKQVSYMEEHPDCSFCFTNGYVALEKELLTERPIIPWDPTAIIKEDSLDYDAGEVEMMGYIPTASFVFRRGQDFLPVEDGSFKGDAYMKISATSYGYAHYFPDCMCAYRRGVAESETSRWGQNMEYYSRICDAYVKMYDSLRGATEHKYDDVLNMRVCQWEIIKYLALEDYAALRRIALSGKLKHLKRANRYTRLTLGMKCRFPRTFQWCHQIGKKLITSLNR